MISSRPDGSDNAYPVGGKSRKGRWFAALVAAVVVGAVGGALAAIRPGPLAGTPPHIFYVAGISDGKQSTPVFPTNPTAPPVTAEAVAAAIQAAVADPRLGPRASAAVVDLGTGERLYGESADVAATPASTIKLLTSAAALVARGPGYRIETKAVAGSQPGEVIIVGGGDPTLSVDGDGSYPGAGTLSDLAAQVTRALGGQPPTKVIVDGSAYPGPTSGPGWLPEDLTDGYATNVTALSTDGARAHPKEFKSSPRYADPAMTAGAQFAKALGLPATDVTTGVAAQGAREYGKVLSPNLARLVEITLTTSDNMLAEALARQVALAKGKPASFDGAAEATGEVLASLGLTPPATQVDGSGLSVRNKVTPAFLTDLLVRAASPEHPELRSLFTGLAVAGYTGTLADRYGTTSDGAGIVRAKTGSLSGVDTLAGVVTTKSGRPLAFALMAVGAPSYTAARDALDKIAVLLARLT